MITNNFALCLYLTGQRISKDGSISVEYTELTADVSVPGNVQCELNSLPIASFHKGKVLQIRGQDLSLKIIVLTVAKLQKKNMKALSRILRMTYNYMS